LPETESGGLGSRGKLGGLDCPNCCAAARANSFPNPNRVGQFLLARYWVISFCSMTLGTPYRTARTVTLTWECQQSPRSTNSVFCSKI